MIDKSLSDIAKEYAEELIKRGSFRTQLLRELDKALASTKDKIQINIKEEKDEKQKTQCPSVKDN